MVQKLRKNPEIMYRISEDNVVTLIDLEVEDYFYQLDGIAAEIFLQIDGTKDWHTIKNDQKGNCEADGEEFETLAEKLLKELVERKLVILY